MSNFSLIGTILDYKGIVFITAKFVPRSYLQFLVKNFVYFISERVDVWIDKLTVVLCHVALVKNICQTTQIYHFENFKLISNLKIFKESIF